MVTLSTVPLGLFREGSQEKRARFTNDDSNIYSDRIFAINLELKGQIYSIGCIWDEKLKFI